MTIEVIRPGLLTSVQDLGRLGWRKFGVIVGGAMDPLALRIANLLVGNEFTDAALEVTLLGPKLQFDADCLIAICGGNLSPQVNGGAVPLWRPVWIRRGSQLRFGEAVAGFRAYIAVAGGFDVPIVLGGRGTYFQAGLGGLEGRPLRRGDCLKTRVAHPRAVRRAETLCEFAGTNAIGSTPWSAGFQLSDYKDRPTIRVTMGRHFDHFSDEVQQGFVSSEFEVTANSDRMGYRLAGPSIQPKTTREFLSEAMLPGTVQVPANGCPIVMMADCPVTGGYPKIAQVAMVDQPVLAQLRPGSKVRFQLISLAEAESLYRARERDIVKLRCALAFR